MKKLLAIFLVLALAGTANAAYIQQIYFEDFESGFTNNADVLGHADWGDVYEWFELGGWAGTSAMEAIDGVGYPDGSETWGLQTTDAYYGARERYIGDPKTSGIWELRAVIKNLHWWNSASIGVYYSGSDAGGDLYAAMFGLSSRAGYAGGWDYNLASVVNGVQTEVQEGDGSLIPRLDWHEMRMTINIDTGVLKAYYRDVSEDGSGTPGAWIYLDTFDQTFPGRPIVKTFFAIGRNQATIDNVQFNEIPEPATLALLVLGGLTLLHRRRK